MGKTLYWTVNNLVDSLDDYPQIKEAATLLQQNETVAFPTETVYGLGANALSDEAIKKIFEAKGRPTDNPLIVHIAEESQVEDFVQSIPTTAKQLMEAFWPGPITIILPKKEGTISPLVTAGLSTVAIRMPDHPIALALIKEAGLPIAAPSANRSGKPSPTTAQHVARDLNGKIGGIVDGGSTGVGLESTVIDCTKEFPIILRPGGITKEQIEQVIGPVNISGGKVDKKETPLSPGMKYKHYAPKAPLYLMDGKPEWIQSVINKKREQGLKVGMLASTETFPVYEADLVLDCGSREDLHTVARNLYSMLRKFDEVDLDCILAEVFPESGVGVAIMNRLEKAAGYQRICEKN